MSNTNEDNGPAMRLKTPALLATGIALGAAGMLFVKQPSRDIHTDFHRAVGQAYADATNAANFRVHDGIGSVNGFPVSYGLVIAKDAGVTNATLTLTGKGGLSESFTMIGGPQGTIFVAGPNDEWVEATNSTAGSNPTPAPRGFE